MCGGGGTSGMVCGGGGGVVPLVGIVSVSISLPVLALTASRGAC